VCCSTMSGSGWYVRHHEQTVDGHWLSVAGHGGQSTVDGVVIEACDELAVNGLVHAVDSFLPSALRRHFPRQPHHRRRGVPAGRADIWAILDALLQ